MHQGRTGVLGSVDSCPQGRAEHRCKGRQTPSGALRRAGVKKQESECRQREASRPPSQLARPLDEPSHSIKRMVCNAFRPSALAAIVVVPDPWTPCLLTVFGRSHAATWCMHRDGHAHVHPNSSVDPRTPCSHTCAMRACVCAPCMCVCVCEHGAIMQAHMLALREARCLPEQNHSFVAHVHIGDS